MKKLLIFMFFAWFFLVVFPGATFLKDALVAFFSVDKTFTQIVDKLPDNEARYKKFNDNDVCKEPLERGYVEENIVDFFNTIYKDYQCQIENELPFSDLKELQGVFSRYENSENSGDLNKETLYKLFFLHKLFTTNSTDDCSSSGILQIPYFWDDTREYIEGNEKNKQRTPKRFLSDLVSNKPKYKYDNCGEFYTFGWCSEREMSFTALLRNMGFKTKIVAEGNHCWTEVLVPLDSTADIKTNYIVEIDNTYDKFLIKAQVDIENDSSWEKTTDYHNENNQCEKYNQDCALCLMDKHYNPRANDKIDNILVNQIPAKRIKKQIDNYFQ